ncbi:MAG TPA: hypothetical protein VMM76_17330 [Pirellulaceae bacterium]|nr:hypothetical protein [Pirellulaceae bacterium]
MNTTRFRTFLLLFMCAALAQGCSRTTVPRTAPAPQTVSGMTRDRTSYTLLKWNEGLAIMLVDHCDVHHMSGSSDTGEPNRRTGDAHWWDEDSKEWQGGYEWQLETTDGRTAVFTVNNVKYDLSQGAVFRIDINGYEATVKQLDHDLSNIQPNRTSCDNFVTADPELIKAAEGSNTE